MDDNTGPARAGDERPRVLIDIPLEGPGRLHLLAETHEDERRLVLWLGGIGLQRLLERVVRNLVDLLDEEQAA